MKMYHVVLGYVMKARRFSNLQNEVSAHIQELLVEMAQFNDQCFSKAF